MHLGMHEQHAFLIGLSSLPVFFPRPNISLSHIDKFIL